MQMLKKILAHVKKEKKKRKKEIHFAPSAPIPTLSLFPKKEHPSLLL